MRRVLVESPSAGATERNVKYLRGCLRDCLDRGEAPFASHALYMQDGVLDDEDPAERRIGIMAGLEWGKVAEATIVYVDFGVSPGMAHGIREAVDAGRPVEHRVIGPERIKALFGSYHVEL
ncbi:MAG TPA: hypothetical protein VJ547_11970 [Candidatus Thermoplasmatota archaeon]|nr:hypothetical protein [Candidatus Thermoplasmatota archaeon]